MSDVRDPETDQVEPTRNEFQYIQDILVRDILERKEFGIKKYGTALQPFNGRDGLKDVYEELLDALIYVTQIRTETPPKFGGPAVLLDKNGNSWVYIQNGDVFACTDNKQYPGMTTGEEAIIVSWQHLNRYYGPLLQMIEVPNADGDIQEGQPADSGNEDNSDDGGISQAGDGTIPD